MTILTMQIWLALPACLLLQEIFPSDSFVYPARHPKVVSQWQALGKLTLLDLSGNSNEKEEIETLGEKKRGGFLPFFGRKVKNEEGKLKTADDSPLEVERTPVARSSSQETTPIASKSGKDGLSKDPVETAKLLRAQAERARLEAERMDAELTLSKIEKLEKQLAHARAKGESVEDLQRQMDNLQAKLRGEPPKPIISPKKGDGKTITSSTSSSVNNYGSPPSSDGKTSNTPGGMMSSALRAAIPTSEIMSRKEFAEDLENFQRAPAFLKKILASLVEVEYETVEDINATEVALRFIMMKNSDFGYSSLPKPSFTQKQIEERIMELKETSD